MWCTLDVFTLATSVRAFKRKSRIYILLEIIVWFSYEGIIALLEVIPYTMSLNYVPETLGYGSLAKNKQNTFNEYRF